MSALPPDANRENYILWEGSYDNLRTSIPYADDRVFRIEPRPFPFKEIIALNCLFVGFFVGAYYLIDYLREDWASDPFERFLVPLFTLGLGSITCLGCTAVYCWRFSRVKKLGTWLIYDKRTKAVSLPRLGLEFELSDIVYLQYITTMIPDRGIWQHNHHLSELNLVTVRDGKRERWNMLKSNIGRRAYNHILPSLLKHTEIPAVRIKQAFSSWDVTITPYT